MNEILQHLKTHGEQLDAEIAQVVGISLTNVRQQLVELTATSASRYYNRQQQDHQLRQRFCNTVISVHLFLLDVSPQSIIPSTESFRALNPEYQTSVVLHAIWNLCELGELLCRSGFNPTCRALQMPIAQ
jgi:hypothetical protein